MNIWLSERIVERCMDPTSPNYRKITKQYAKRLFLFKSNIIPRVGEVFFVDENRSYDVVNVIYNFSKPANQYIAVSIEVVPHVEKHMYNEDGYSFEEDWPLLSNLEVPLEELNEESEEEY